MSTAEQSRIDLEIGGMTCASCAMRIEKKLNKLDGVTATVNYATEKAQVTVAGDIDPAVLITTVEDAGYTAALPTPPAPAAAAAEADAEDPELRSLRQRLIGWSEFMLVGHVSYSPPVHAVNRSPVVRVNQASTKSVFHRYVGGSSVQRIPPLWFVGFGG